jgi:hypothetical protein
MEQYQLKKSMDIKNLELCIREYVPDYLFIRDCGGVREDGKYHCEGMEKVGESLEGKTLGFRKSKDGLYILVDQKEVFHFPLDNYSKGFSLAYERTFPDGRMHIPYGISDDPYNPKLPEPKRSFLRDVIDNHLIEIFFKGRIGIKFHSWWNKPHWKYWTIISAEESKKMQNERMSIDIRKKND